MRSRLRPRILAVVGRALGPRDLGRSPDDLREGIEDERVELAAPLLPHHRERPLHRQGPSVDAFGRERVENVRHGGDPALERDRIAGEAARITLPVPALVVHERDRRREVQHLRGRAAQEPMADLGVAPHRAALVVGEGAPLQQDLVGDGDLADVVQRARIAQQAAAILLEAEASRDLLAHPRHPLRVMTGLRIAELGCVREPADRLRLSTTQLELRTAQPGDRVEKLLLGAAPLGQLRLEALMEARVVQRDCREPAEPVEERDLLGVEGRRVGTREPDHSQDPLGSAKRRADDRAERERPEPLRFARRAREVDDGQRLSLRRDAPCEPFSELNAETDALDERPQPSHHDERLAVGLDEVEIPVVGTEERTGPGEDQAEELRHLVAVGNEHGGLVQRIELRTRE